MFHTVEFPFGFETLDRKTNWIFATLLTTFFPPMVTAFPPGSVFLFFCATMGPETKGRTGEEIQRDFDAT